MYKHFETIYSRPRFNIAVLFMFVFIVRIIVAGGLFYPEKEHRALNTDQWGGIAKNLVDGYGYVGGQGHVKPEEAKPNSERGPVPVFFFAALFYLFGYKLWVVMIANWLCDLGTAYLLYMIAKEVFPYDLCVAYIAIFLWAIYVPEILLTNRTYSEPLFTLILIAHIWTLIKLQKSLTLPMAFLCGILLGLSLLARGHMLFFLPVALISIMLTKGIEKKIFNLRWLKKYSFICGVITLTFTLTLVPWIIRNYYIFSAFIPAGTLASYGLLRNNINLDKENFMYNSPSRGKFYAIVEKELKKKGETLHGKSILEKDKIFRQLAFEKITAHPGRYLIASGYRFCRLWFNIGYGVKPSKASYMVMFLNGFFLILSLVAFTFFRVPKIRYALPVVGIVIYTVIIWVLITAQVRYIFPVMPYVLLFASFSIKSIVEKVSYNLYT